MSSRKEVFIAVASFSFIGACVAMGVTEFFGAFYDFSQMWLIPAALVGGGIGVGRGRRYQGALRDASGDEDDDEQPVVAQAAEGDTKMGRKIFTIISVSGAIGAIIGLIVSGLRSGEGYLLDAPWYVCAINGAVILIICIFIFLIVAEVLRQRAVAKGEAGPATERSALREKAAKLGASVWSRSRIFERYLPVFILVIVIGMGVRLNSQVSSVSKRTADVEIALAGKADTTTVVAQSDQIALRAMQSDMNTVREDIGNLYAWKDSLLRADAGLRTGVEEASNAAAVADRHAGRVEAFAVKAARAEVTKENKLLAGYVDNKIAGLDASFKTYKEKQSLRDAIQDSQIVSAMLTACQAKAAFQVYLEGKAKTNYKKRR